MRRPPCDSPRGPAEDDGLLPEADVPAIPVPATYSLSSQPIAKAEVTSRPHHVVAQDCDSPNGLGYMVEKLLDASASPQHNHHARIGLDAGEGCHVKQLQELVVELTDRCPMSCNHCSSGSGPMCRAALKEDVLFRLLAEASELRARKVSFGGGEPTVSPLLLPALREAARLGIAAEVFSCGITSAGQQPPISFSEEFVIAVSDLPGDAAFVFSFHGSSAQVHDSVTGVRGSFELLTRSVRRTLAQGIRCAANFVPTRMNVHDLPAVVSLLESLGIGKLSVLRFVPQGRGQQNRKRLELSREEEHEFVQELLGLRSRSDVDIRTGSPFNGIIPDNNVPCRAGFHKLVVQADGNVLPCEVFKDATRRDWGASVHRMSLAAILDSEQFSALRKLLFEGRCATCPVHGILRANQPRSGAMHGLSKAAF